MRINFEFIEIITNSSSPMKPLMHFLEPLVGNVSVELRGGNARMPEEFLH